LTHFSGHYKTEFTCSVYAIPASFSGLPLEIRVMQMAGAEKITILMTY